MRRLAAGLPPKPPGGRMLPPHKRPKDYTPLSWDEFWDSREEIEVENDRYSYYSKGSDDAECILFLIHGGGFSGLSFSLFAKEMVNIANVRIIAPDVRGHGSTLCQDESDLSIERLTLDMKIIYDEVIQNKTCILVGHSMGGAIAVHLAQDVPALGLIVIDVVEGTAIDALPAMEALLRGRPNHFRNKAHAVEWALKTNYIKNLKSAKISMPDQVVEATVNDSIICQWRINLANSAQFWRGWFTGLSDLYLSSPPVKMLLLAGMDRLDTALTVGQMQGKFQLTCMPQSGHAIHEDQPLKVAQNIGTFIIRHKLATANPNFTPVQAVPGLGGLGRLM